MAYNDSIFIDKYRVDEGIHYADINYMQRIVNTFLDKYRVDEGIHYALHIIYIRPVTFGNL